MKDNKTVKDLLNEWNGLNESVTDVSGVYGEFKKAIKNLEKAVEATKKSEQLYCNEIINKINGRLKDVKLKFDEKEPIYLYKEEDESEVNSDLGGKFIYEDDQADLIIVITLQEYDKDAVVEIHGSFINDSALYTIRESSAVKIVNQVVKWYNNKFGGR